MVRLRRPAVSPTHFAMRALAIQFLRARSRVTVPASPLAELTPAEATTPTRDLDIAALQMAKLALQVCVMLGSEHLRDDRIVEHVILLGSSRQDRRLLPRGPKSGSDTKITSGFGT